MSDLQAWPETIPDTPLASSVQITPYGVNPIITEMEGGNTRIRRRPGDNVTLLRQTIRMTAAQLAAFNDFYANVTVGGSKRFRANVWSGSTMENRVCLFNLSAGGPQYTAVSGLPDYTDVAMSLRVWG